MQIFVNFFAPHHGFNLRDTYFGIGKQMVREQHRHKLTQSAEDIWKLFQNIINWTVAVLEESQFLQCLDISSFSSKEGSNNIRTFILYPMKLYFVEKIQGLKIGLKLKFVNKIAVY